MQSSQGAADDEHHHEASSQEWWSPPIAIIRHELIDLVLEHQLSGVLFWRFSMSPGETLSDACLMQHYCPFCSRFLVLLLQDLADHDGSIINEWNVCFRQVLDTKRFRNWSLHEHGNVNSPHSWELIWSYSSHHSKVETAAEYLEFNTWKFLRKFSFMRRALILSKAIWICLWKSLI